MLPKDTIFKSFLSPAIATFNGITYVVPGWHLIPSGTTLEEVNKHWVKEVPTGISHITPQKEIEEIVISERTGEKYTVSFSRNYWSCTCMGFGFRGRCKHIDKVKSKYVK